MKIQVNKNFEFILILIKESQKFWFYFFLLYQLAVLEPDPECLSSDTEASIFLPEPTNCEIFYQCSNGYKIQIKCPAGLHFNPTKTAFLKNMHFFYTK